MSSYPPRSDLPFATEYLLDLYSQNYSPCTVRSRAITYNRLYDFLASKGTPFAQMTPSLLGEFKSYLLSQGKYRSWTHTSLNVILVHLRCFFKWLADMDYSPPFPAERIKSSRTEKKQLELPSFSQILALIEYPTKHERHKLIALRNRAIFEVFFSTGLRASELIGLDRAQLNGHQNRILIMGKGKKQRWVYLTPRALDHLNAYLATRADDRPALFIPYKKHGPTISPRLHIHTIEMAVKKYCQALGISQKFTPHTLRHAFATALAEKGINPAILQGLLGHEALGTTGRYVHMADKSMEQAHAQFHPFFHVKQKSLKKATPKQSRPRGRPRKIKKRGRPRKAQHGL